MTLTRKDLIDAFSSVGEYYMEEECGARTCRLRSVIDSPLHSLTAEECEAQMSKNERHCGGADEHHEYISKVDAILAFLIKRP